MREVPILTVGRATLTASEAAAVGPLCTLADVMAWARTLTPPRSPHSIVTQDEYTHDVLLVLDERRFLVFDTT